MAVDLKNFPQICLLLFTILTSIKMAKSGINDILLKVKETSVRRLKMTTKSKIKKFVPHSKNYHLPVGVKW